ncbi:MAG: HlyD family efflux transporter periplasmic adaptor subunit [Anaerolineae bacterium]|nr:HlyD family efflux transporter periplasmic adaptor subunit [Anaerolineae bacterium]
MDKICKRAFVIGIVVVFALAFAACSGPGDISTEETQTDDQGPPQPTLPPSTQAGRAVVADGQLVSAYPSLPLGFGGGVGGQVLTVTVGVGDVVAAGERLALLDDADLQRAVLDAQVALDRAEVDHERALSQWEQDLVEAEENLAAAERSLTTARLQYSTTGLEEARTALQLAQQAEANAEEAYQRALNSWPPIPSDPYYDSWQRAIRERELAEMRLADAQDANSASYLELAAREEDVARAGRALAALQAGIAPTYERAVADARQRLADAQDALGYAELVAPWPAMILSIDVAPATSVGPGTPVVTLLNVAEELCFVTQNLNEQHVGYIQPGQRAVVTLRAYASTPLEGMVEALVPQEGRDVADSRFVVHVRLAPTELNLLPGLTGRVEIVTGEE